MSLLLQNSWTEQLYQVCILSSDSIDRDPDKLSWENLKNLFWYQLLWIQKYLFWHQLPWIQKFRSNKIGKQKEKSIEEKHSNWLLWELFLQLLHLILNQLTLPLWRSTSPLKNCVSSKNNMVGSEGWLKNKSKNMSFWSKRRNGNKKFSTQELQLITSLMHHWWLSHLNTLGELETKLGKDFRMGLRLIQMSTLKLQIQISLKI